MTMPISHTIEATIPLTMEQKQRKLTMGEYWDDYGVYWKNAYERCYLIDPAGMERDPALTKERMPKVREHVIQQIDADNAWMK